MICLVFLVCAFSRFIGFSTVMSNGKYHTKFTDCDWEHGDQWEVSTLTEKMGE